MTDTQENDTAETPVTTEEVMGFLRRTTDLQRRMANDQRRATEHLAEILVIVQRTEQAVIDVQRDHSELRLIGEQVGRIATVVDQAAPLLNSVPARAMRGSASVLDHLRGGGKRG